MMISKTQEAAMLMSSLSIYKGIIKRTVPGAYYRLLCAVDAPVHDFLRAWGEFVALLSDRGYADSLAKCLTEAALFDENAFSRMCAAGKADELKKLTVDAVNRDISAINKISRIRPIDIISDYVNKASLGSVALSLPKWEVGEPVEQFRNEEKAASLLHVTGHLSGVEEVLSLLFFPIRFLFRSLRDMNIRENR